MEGEYLFLFRVLVFARALVLCPSLSFPDIIIFGRYPSNPLSAVDPSSPLPLLRSCTLDICLLCLFSVSFLLRLAARLCHRRPSVSSNYSSKIIDLHLAADCGRVWAQVALFSNYSRSRTCPLLVCITLKPGDHRSLRNADRFFLQPLVW